jgi:hypothetical protein
MSTKGLKVGKNSIICMPNLNPEFFKPGYTRRISITNYVEQNITSHGTEIVPSFCSDSLAARCCFGKTLHVEENRHFLLKQWLVLKSKRGKAYALMILRCVKA